MKTHSVDAQFLSVKWNEIILKCFDTLKYTKSRAENTPDREQSVFVWTKQVPKRTLRIARISFPFENCIC